MPVKDQDVFDFIRHFPRAEDVISPHCGAPAKFADFFMDPCRIIRERPPLFCAAEAAELRDCAHVNFVKPGMDDFKWEDGGHVAQQVAYQQTGFLLFWMQRVEGATAFEGAAEVGVLWEFCDAAGVSKAFKFRQNAQVVFLRGGNKVPHFFRAKCAFGGKLRVAWEFQDTAFVISKMPMKRVVTPFL